MSIKTEIACNYAVAQLDDVDATEPKDLNHLYLETIWTCS